SSLDAVPFFFVQRPAATEIYTLSLHDALPISEGGHSVYCRGAGGEAGRGGGDVHRGIGAGHQVAVGVLHLHREAEGLPGGDAARSEEHTSELQSQSSVVCRLLLEKKTQGLRGR